MSSAPPGGVETASTPPPVQDPDVRVALDIAIRAANLERYARDCTDELRRQRTSWLLVRKLIAQLNVDVPALDELAAGHVARIEALGIR